MNLILAWGWTICLIVDIISCAVGDQPSWILVFCPLTILVWDRWDHYIQEKRHG